MKIKKIFFVFLYLGGFFVCKSQDTIYKINGEKIISIISEVNPTDIKYQRFDFQNGPQYIELKQNIRKIVYSNGVVDVYKNSNQGNFYLSNKLKAVNYSDSILLYSAKEKIFLCRGDFYSESQIQKYLLSNSDSQINSAAALAKKSRSFQHIGVWGSIVFSLLSLNLLESAIESKAKNESLALASGAVLCGIVAIACPIVASVSKGRRDKNNKIAIDLYNQRYANK